MPKTVSNNITEANNRLLELGFDLNDPLLYKRRIKYILPFSPLYSCIVHSFYNFGLIKPEDIFIDSKESLNSNIKEVTLYFHIPFCLKKCSYCLFYTCQYHNPEELNTYLYFLKKEISVLQDTVDFKRLLVKRVYIGGGSPSILKRNQFEDLLRLIKDKFILSKDVQVLIEIEPETSSKAKDTFLMLRQNGVNSISLGVQTFDKGILKLIGRADLKSHILETMGILHSLNFQNINIDLLFNSPGQTLINWESDLEETLRLLPTSISLNSLIVNRLPVYKLYHKHINLFPTYKDSLLIRCLAEVILSKEYATIDYSQYIKNNLVNRTDLCLNRKLDVIAFGPRTWSRWNGTEYYNWYNLALYKKALSKDRLPIWVGMKNYDENMANQLCQNLISSGEINLDEVLKRKEQLYYKKKFERLERLGYGNREGMKFKLNAKGKFCFFPQASFLVSKKQGLITYLVTTAIHKNYILGYSYFWLKERDITVFLYNLFITRRIYFKIIFILFFTSLLFVILKK